MMTTSRAAVPRHRAPRTMPPRLRSVALAVSGALLAVTAATSAAPLLPAARASAQGTPDVVPATVGAASVQGRTVVFGYSVDVAPNDVYDTERAEAPLPLFRSLGETVDVRADYTGPPAHLRLVARLSSITGWSTTVPLATEVEVAGRGRVGAALDLRRLETRAALVAEQTGMPFEGMTVELVAAVRDDRGTWTPSVALQLSRQQLRLAGAPSTLVVRQEAAGSGGTALPAAPTPRSRLAELLDRRPDGLLTALLLALSTAGGAVVVRCRQAQDEAGRARRRLGRLLLDARPLDLTGVQVVEVASPTALARVAERYSLLVLHWTDGSGAVFVVHDGPVAYRWTTDRRAVPTAGAVGVKAERREQAQVAVPAPRRGEHQDLVPEPSSRQVG